MFWVRAAARRRCHEDCARASEGLSRKPVGQGRARFLGFVRRWHAVWHPPLCPVFGGVGSLYRYLAWFFRPMPRVTSESLVRSLRAEFTRRAGMICRPGQTNVLLA